MALFSCLANKSDLHFWILQIREYAYLYCFSILVIAVSKWQNFFNFTHYRWIRFYF